ncbi:5-formyltetrahydrofolate cyclo-ligase [Quadrisphaera granulorum]|uniref:5-formyltetrahydrofolate cyclo-ligase n=1 Tax=Quadrisphaera granulorum TaxID=317664 RepID=A0A316ACP1_9ACTN|nr:5-formyltetrahydrofolate cyclo-ligase [Quadrisphaera granulorum]PWJ55169.1 5-formyltetrahydrofolate cyclo-ligase [Quadrisphaera granulorum]SZE95678.1 5-formyltetrahydrofolate cyclo-ligase [Quadrisphaera granulorum]
MEHHPTGRSTEISGSTAPAALTKAQLRAGVRAARRDLDDDARAHLDAALAREALADGSPLAGLPAGAVVALYDSLPTEPGTRALREALAARGLVVILPVVVGRDAALDWEIDSTCGGGPWPHGVHGVDVVLLPALAVARDGTRLGQGGGHYDRTLAALRAQPLLAAVVRDEELLPAGALPREPHDVLVEAALTPSGWTAFA